MLTPGLPFRTVAILKPSRKPVDADAELDAAELTHLAIRAMQRDKDADALRLLQRAAERDPTDGRPHHLLGAIFAAQGEVQKAIEAMTQALAVDPQLSVARFQLGLLQLTSGNVSEARSVWQPLDDLVERDPLRLFKTGMLHLVSDEFEDCVALLEQGIALCESPSINKDMQRVVEKVRPLLAATPPGVAESPAPNREQHVMLARYEQSIELSGDQTRPKK